MDTPPESEYMKIADAARFLGITQRWVYRRVLSGELPASKIGGLYFIRRKDLQALLEGGRVRPGEAEPAGTLPRLKCGFCYRLLKDDGEIGGDCAGEDCVEVICLKCWQLNIHTCVRHSPTRDQRLQKAIEQKNAGRISVLVLAPDARLAETSFLNRIHARLGTFSTLIHPVTGEARNISSWEEILQRGDGRAELMQLLGRVALDAATTAQMPLNAWHQYSLKSRKARGGSPVELHVHVVSDMEQMVRDGFASAPLGVGDLNRWIEHCIEAPIPAGGFRLVLLASTTGWDDAVRRIINPASGAAFSHRLALLYLYDLVKNELIYNMNDDRARRYAEIFRPALPSEELTQVIRGIIGHLGGHDSITLTDAQQHLPFPPEVVQQAFLALAENGEYVLTEIKGLGTTLVKRQAL